MNLVLFISVLVISFIVVRIGAIAFQLTGLEWSVAKFQALSCFTSTGFTTKEAELITNSLQRRRIASVLIVLGHAGLVTMIATFANSLRPRALSIPFVPFDVPENVLLWVNLAIISAAIYATYKIFTNTAFVRKLTIKLRERIVKRKIIKCPDLEELATVTAGYGIFRIEIKSDSPILTKAPSVSDLKNSNIIPLTIQREGATTFNPAPDMQMQPGDNLVCFGKPDIVREKTCAKDL